MSIDKEELIRTYLKLGCDKDTAIYCAELEITQKAMWEKDCKTVLKKIDKDAVVYNHRLKKKKLLTKRLIAFKKDCYEKRVRKTRKYNHAKAVYDPNGVFYKTTSEMCQAWGTLLATYCNRRAKGWTMLEALTGKKPTTSEKEI